MNRQNTLSDVIFDNNAHMCMYFSRMIPVIPYTCLTGKEIQEGKHGILFPEAEFFLVRENIGYQYPVILNKNSNPDKFHTYGQYLVSPIDDEDHCFSLPINIDPNYTNEVHKPYQEEYPIVNTIGKHLRQMNKMGRHEVFFAIYKGELRYCGIRRISDNQTRKTQPA